MQYDCHNRLRLTPPLLQYVMRWGDATGPAWRQLVGACERFGCMVCCCMHSSMSHATACAPAVVGGSHLSPGCPRTGGSSSRRTTHHSQQHLISSCCSSSWHTCMANWLLFHHNKNTREVHRTTFWGITQNANQPQATSNSLHANTSRLNCIQHTWEIPVHTSCGATCSLAGCKKRRSREAQTLTHPVTPRTLPPLPSVQQLLVLAGQRRQAPPRTCC
jgi:hypothetical protein